MKITNLSNVEGFLKTVSECKGTVELVTKEGDRLNLKSELTKYVALTSFSRILRFLRWKLFCQSLMML